MGYKAIDFIPDQPQTEVDGVPVRFKIDKSNQTEKAEALWNGKWNVLWKARKTSKGGVNAFVMRQQDLKKAVWKLVNVREPRLCVTCGLMVEGDPVIIRSRSCKSCRNFQS